MGGISRVKKASMSVKKAAAQKLQQLPTSRHGNSAGSTLDKQQSSTRGQNNAQAPLDTRSMSAQASLIDLSVPGTTGDTPLMDVPDARRPQCTGGASSHPPPPASHPKSGSGVDLLS